MRTELDKIYPLYTRSMAYLLAPLLMFIFNFAMFFGSMYVYKGDMQSDFFTLGLVGLMIVVLTGALAFWLYARHTLRRSVVSIEGRVLLCTEGTSTIQKVERVSMLLRARLMEDTLQRCGGILYAQGFYCEEPGVHLGPVTVLRFCQNSVRERVLRAFRGVDSDHYWLIHPALKPEYTLICVAHALEKTILSKVSKRRRRAPTHVAVLERKKLGGIDGTTNS